MITKFLKFEDIRGKDQKQQQDLYIINYGNNKYLYKTNRQNDISYIGITLLDKNYYEVLIQLLDIVYAKYKTDDYIYFDIDTLKQKLELEETNNLFAFNFIK